MKLFNREDGGRKDNNSSNKKIKRLSLEVISKTFLTWLQLGVFIVLLIATYITASIFSLSTGTWGKIIKYYLVDNFGGAILIPLLYIGYMSISFLLRKRVPSFIRQLAGTIALFFCCSHVLGLFSISGTTFPFDIMYPGKMGTYIATILYTKTGALGAVLTGLLMALVSSILYGFVHVNLLIDKTLVILSQMKDMGKSLKSFLRSVSHKPGTEKGGSEIDEAESSHLKDAEKIIPERKESFLKSSDVNPLIMDDDPKPERITTAGRMDNINDPVNQTGTDQDGYFLEEEDPEKSATNGFPLKIKKGIFPPPLDLFGPSQINDQDVDRSIIEEQGQQVISTLNDFGIQAELAEIVVGPTVIQFQLQLAPGIKVSRVAGLSNDLAVSLAVPALRVEAPIPFKPYVGIEIPAPHRRSVTIRSILETQEFKDTHFQLPLPAGLRVNSNPLLINLEDLPHLLVAGTTGSGKSVFVTSCITGLCCQRTPEELRLLMIDPKRVELNIYEHLPHVLCKPVVSPKKAVHALGWAVREMEHRYEVFARSRVRNLASYNSKVLPKDKLPRIVIIVDELADLMFTAQKEVEDFICRLAQMARATGIHLILATQRPSVNVVTGLIKANIPARVAFTLPSQADSRTIIDLGGAEKLLGKGDMLFVSSKYPRPVRVQSPYMDETQSINFINYMKDLFGEPEYVDLEDQGESSNTERDTAYLDDPLIEEAVSIILGTGIASASRLQRQLRIGFTRAARIIDTLEQIGIVGPQEGSKPREILVDEDQANELFEQSIG